MARAPAKSDLDAARISHKYRLPDGTVAVNVTTISDLLDNGKSGAFAGAATKLLREGKDYRKEWKDKADRGSRIHAHLESWLRHEDIEVAPEEEGYVDALSAFIQEHVPNVLAMEAITLSMHGYGGRFDLLAELDGLNWLLDLKTGKQYPVEHTLQLSAYRYADGIAQYDDSGTLLPDLLPLPPVDKTGCIYVHEDGSYQLVEYPADRSAHQMFLRLLDVYLWTRSEPLSTLVKEAKKPAPKEEA